MARRDALAAGLEAFARKQWREAHRQLSAADARSPLALAALEQLATAAYLIGKESDALALWKRAHHAFIEQGHPQRAARSGFWLSLNLMLSGETAQSAGWLARTRRLLEGHPHCVEQGYASILTGLVEMGKGDATRAVADFDQAIALADRHGDSDLMALGLLSRGQALVQAQKPTQGVALLDEAMARVTSGEVSPIAAGIVYCAVILTCQRLFDLPRSKEWTLALDEWCAAQPDLVPFRGECLLHRSEILQLQGQWSHALAEAQQACQWSVRRAEREWGRPFYRRAEIHRLRGEYALADEMYQEASRNGTEPQPGVSLLRLAQGELAAATAAIRRVVDEGGDRQGPGGGSSRAAVLGPYVEIMLAASDLDAARAGADELMEIASEIDAPLLDATSAHATGAVLLAEGKAKAALDTLRAAWAIWQQLDVPYESARVRVLIGRACHQLGDHDTASSHFDAARSTFERLGAAPDLSQLEQPTATAPEGSARLTDRELQVLRLVASGRTNRQIAAELSISEHTVARHLANIYNKLGVTSRTAAATFAFEHDLL